jgi:hypothetical protein
MRQSEKALFEKVIGTMTREQLAELVLAKNTTIRSSKTSINGAPISLEGVKVVEKHGELKFSHPQYKVRSYPIAVLSKANELIELEQFNKKPARWLKTSNGFVKKKNPTEEELKNAEYVRFVSVDDDGHPRPIAESLVIFARNAGLL